MLLLLILLLSCCIACVVQSDDAVIADLRQQLSAQTTSHQQQLSDLQSKLLWYAENQALLGQSDHQLAQQAALIRELEGRLREADSRRTTHKQAAQRIKELEQQVKRTRQHAAAEYLCWALCTHVYLSAQSIADPAMSVRQVDLRADVVLLILPSVRVCCTGCCAVSTWESSRQLEVIPRVSCNDVTLLPVLLSVCVIRCLT